MVTVEEWVSYHLQLAAAIIMDNLLEVVKAC